MLPVNCGSHADYQNFVTENLRKYYPNPDAIARSTWDIIERFWTLVYLTLTCFCVINTLNSVLLPERLPVCSVLTFCPLTLRLLP